MNGELLYARNPWHNRIIWAIFYIALSAVVLAGLYLAANQIKTHTLPIGGIQLSVPYSKYVVGETVTFTIKNNFNSAIYIVNNCPTEPLAVYRREGNSWVRIHDQAPSESCSEEQRQVSVPARGSTNGNFAAWPHLFDQAGKYRVVAYIESYNSLPYQDFTVIAKPVPPARQNNPVQNSLTTPNSNTPAQNPTTTLRPTENNDHEQVDN